MADVTEQELIKFFTAFDLAEKSYNEIMQNFPPQSRSRGLEANILNSCVIREVQKQFTNSCKFLKYKRFALMYNGYTFLFKKLDKRGVPMNRKYRQSKSFSRGFEVAF